MLREQVMFRTSKTQTELDAMSDEDYFLEVINGLRTEDYKPNKWWDKTVKTGEQLSSEDLKAVYDECTRNG